VTLRVRDHPERIDPNFRIAGSIAASAAAFGERTAKDGNVFVWSGAEHLGHASACGASLRVRLTPPTPPAPDRTVHCPWPLLATRLTRGYK